MEITEIYPILNELTTFNGRRTALSNLGLKKLGEGSGRTVFEVDKTRIIKVAKNPKGQAQNEVEADLSPVSNMFAHVLREGEEDSWLVCQNAKRVSRADFKIRTGMSFDNFSFMVKQFGAELKNSAWVDGSLDRDVSFEIESNLFFISVMELIAEKDLSAGDLSLINSYGCIGDQVVIIDYGLTHDVFQRFYKKKKVEISSSGW